MTRYPRVRKAVIPAAGLGTRFLPATKAIPKEMLPIVDTPTLQYIVEEVAAAGIETVILVTAKGKSAIEDHFDLNSDYQAKLEADGKKELARVLNYQSSLVNVVSVRQKNPRGLGHAVLCAREVVGDEPFLVVLGDDIVDAKVPCAKQMLDVFAERQQPIVSLMPVSDEDVPKFGICGGKKISDRLMEITAMVEKPKKADAPSNLAIVGRYVLTPEIFEILATQPPGKGNEIQLTDAMATLMKKQGFLGYTFEGQRYDAGDKFGFVQANIAFGLKNPEIAPKLYEYMAELVRKKGGA